MKKILYITKNAIMFYCLIFTIGTLANTILWLYFGLATNPDVHGHIMIRAGLCLVITIIVYVIVSLITAIKCLKANEKS